MVGMNPKQNKSLARVFILLGTLAAGIGIWTAVNRVPVAASSGTTVQAVAVTNPGFNANDAFLSQPQLQSQPFQSQQTRSPRLRTRGS